MLAGLFPWRALRVRHPFAAALERSSPLRPFQRARANAACCSPVTRFIRFRPPFRPIAARYRRISLSSATPGAYISCSQTARNDARWRCCGRRGAGLRSQTAWDETDLRTS
jgi:hypothetical protein